MNSPYAKLLVAVNGGAPQRGDVAAPLSGGVTVPSAATVQLSGDSTNAWTTARFEALDYPEGWATPSGWTLESDGTISCVLTGPYVPPAITLPAAASTWGKWVFRLIVNEQILSTAILGDGSLISQMMLSMHSANGLRDIAAREGGEFTDAVTVIKKWTRDLQHDLRVLDGIASGVAGSGEGAIVTITSATPGYVDPNWTGDRTRTIVFAAAGTPLVLGFKAPPNGRSGHLRLVSANADSAPTTIKHQNGGTPAWDLAAPDGTDLFIPGGGGNNEIFYDASQQRWRPAGGTAAGALGQFTFHGNNNVPIGTNRLTANPNTGEITHTGSPTHQESGALFLDASTAATYGVPGAPRWGTLHLTDATPTYVVVISWPAATYGDGNINVQFFGAYSKANADGGLINIGARVQRKAGVLTVKTPTDNNTDTPDFTMGAVEILKIDDDTFGLRLTGIAATLINGSASANVSFAKKAV